MTEVVDRTNSASASALTDHSNAPTTIAPNGSTANKQADPSEVGWLFVPQYYLLLNQEPQRLHRFYTKMSTLIHGVEQEDTTPCFGQQAIHNKIMSLGFNDCKVFVSSVDSQTSANGGIVIQVLGEMSNKDGPWRKFAQTFFLAEQPNGYFVLNDIFRYLKEDDETEQQAQDIDDALAEEVSTAEREGKVVSHHLDLTGPSEEEHSAQTLSTTDVHNSTSDDPPEGQQIETLSARIENGQASQAQDTHLSTLTSAPGSAAPIQGKSDSSTPDQAVQSSERSSGDAADTQRTHHKSAQLKVGAAPDSVQSVESANDVDLDLSRTEMDTAAPVSEATAAAAQTQTPAPSKPAAPKTWANLAASNAGKWSTAVASDARGVSAAPPRPVVAENATRPSANASQSARPPPSAAQSRGPHRGDDEASVFVKNVNADRVKTEALRRALGQHGSLLNVHMIPQKLCAFADFASPEDARRAVSFSAENGGITIDGWTVSVEEKRRTDRVLGGGRNAGPGQGPSQRGGGLGRGRGR